MDLSCKKAMRDCSLWETNSFCHMQHRAARCASRVPRWQRPMDCPLLSYRSCCSPITSGCRPAKTFSFFLWCRLPHVDVGSLYSFIQSFEGIALKIREHSTSLLEILLYERHPSMVSWAYWSRLKQLCSCWIVSMVCLFFSSHAFWIITVFPVYVLSV